MVEQWNDGKKILKSVSACHRGLDPKSTVPWGSGSAEMTGVVLLHGFMFKPNIPIFQYSNLFMG